MARSAGVVFYRGASQLDGAPVVGIATGLKRPSRNVKTGPMVQTWILRADLNPLESIHTGADYSVCGDCQHRGAVLKGRNVRRSCYVTVARAPLATWQAWARGAYPDLPSLESDPFAGRLVRLGAYGDPAAIPLAIWEHVLARAQAWTGYTHQWLRFPLFRPYLMASVDSESEWQLAKAMGWRTFRVARNPSRLPAEISCPASEESGHRSTCAQCRLCAGLASKSPKDIVIRDHGPGHQSRNAA